jgi:hypothetical protein
MEEFPLENCRTASFEKHPVFVGKPGLPDFYCCSIPKWGNMSNDHKTYQRVINIPKGH